MMDKQLRGKWGEDWVRFRYETLGYRLLNQRLRLARCELDLLFKKGDIMVAVEVKTRRLTHFLPDAVYWSLAQRNRAWFGLRELAFKCMDVNEFRLDFAAVHYSGSQRMMQVLEGGKAFKFKPHKAAFCLNNASSVSIAP